MQVQQNVNLQKLNTFGLNVTAKYLVDVHSVDELKAVLESDIYSENDVMILGGGSNVLFVDNFNGLIIRNQITGIEVLEEHDSSVTLKIGAGENWHSTVLFAIENNWGGIENLSLIPGTVGAAPMQNIGAYGVEIKDVFAELEAVNLSTGELEVFKNEDCEFGYRESVFKRSKKGQYMIVSVSLQLSKLHKINSSYGAINDTLQADGIDSPTIQDVSNAVIKIRKSKLPDPNEIGNAGSFFKNPSIPTSAYESLKQTYQDIPGYQQPANLTKVPAGWLIERCGWKGKQIGEIGVHKHQALVLVNHGNGRGADIRQLAQDIQQSVKDKFNIDLTPEVNII